MFNINLWAVVKSDHFNLSVNVAASDSERISGPARQKVIIILIITPMTSKEIKVEQYFQQQLPLHLVKTSRIKDWSEGGISQSTSADVYLVI